ncbi:hypothetical protein DXG01_001920, partial [Tephrocybe rancida]
MHGDEPGSGDEGSDYVPEADPDDEFHDLLVPRKKGKKKGKRSKGNKSKNKDRIKD